MKFRIFSAALCAGLTVLAASALAQNADDATVTASKSYPLAVKQDIDSHADKIAPPGAVNQGPYNMKTWKYGHVFDAAPGTPLWNPVKVKMSQGGKITSASIPGNADPAV